MSAKFEEGQKVIHRRRGIGIYCGLSWEGETCYVDFGEGEERVTLALIDHAPGEQEVYGNDCPNGRCET